MVEILAPTWAKALPGAARALSWLLASDVIGILAAMVAASVLTYYSARLSLDPSRSTRAAELAAAFRRSQRGVKVGRHLLLGLILGVPVVFMSFRLTGRAMQEVLELTLSINLFAVLLPLYRMAVLLYHALKKSASLLEQSLAREARGTM